LMVDVTAEEAIRSANVLRDYALPQLLSVSGVQRHQLR
jgi:hypothetical protein